MKSPTLTTMILCFFSCLIYQVAGQWEGIRSAENRALVLGAKTKVVFLVVDENNAPVCDALVDAAFDINDETGIIVKARTNQEGIVTAENTSVGEINYNVTKDGWYRHVERIRFFGPGKKDTVIDGKWQPYGATHRIVLRQKKNPIPMYMKRVRADYPIKNEFIGYDLGKGDWMKPYGDGEILDILLKYEEQLTDVPRRTKCALTMRFPNRADGAYVREKIPGSEFPSDYHADLQENYQSEWIFVYDRWSDKMKIDNPLEESKYMVLRTRTKKDPAGKLISAHYTKMYGIMIFVGRFGVQYYFNPNVNDTNLEFALDKSLFENQRTNVP